MRQPSSSVLPTGAPGENYAPPGQARPNLTERTAGWSARHRKTAVLGWLLLVAAVFVAGQAFGSRNLPQYDSGQSGQAERLLNRITPAQYDSYSENVLIQAGTPGATFATDPAMRAAARQVAASLAAQPKYATGIRTPLSPGGGSQVSADGRSALVTFQVPGNVASVDQAASADLRAVAAVQARHPDLRIAEAGDATISQAINNSLNFRTAEAISVPITLILLLVVFGALVAAGIPVLLAVTALTAAIGGLTIVSHWLPVTSSTFEVVVIIGMAVGVDYSLFYLRREREERAKGLSPAEALQVTARTSGRTILVSGLTVMAAMSGLFLVGGGPFTGIALGTVAVVSIAVVGSLTVLPALLAWLGPKADGGRIPFLGRARAAARPSRFWAALARRVVARPLIWGSVATVALLALAAPALGLRLGEPAVDAPKGSPVIATMDAIQRAFPHAPAPAEVVVSGHDVTGPRVAAAVDAIRARAAAGGAIHEPVTATAVAGGRALVVGVPLAGSGSDAASDHALLALRDQILPATLGKVPGVSYAVAGDTAGLYDDIQQLHVSLPAVFAFVAVLAFVLLLVAFRSAVIPLVSIGLNLLSVGAAYGLITLIFQDGRLQGLLGYTSFGGVIFWVPLMMFVFLFGISMDYHVFILSRIRELWARGSAPKDAVVGGIASSAGVVTSAALIMVAVFSIFVTMPLVDLKTLGVGTAAAVLIDATIVRGVLLPAALALLGDRAWRARPARAQLEPAKAGLLSRV
ncbi:MAG TPA: MMPL family transporter [Streptosporangiaceae bacterium]|nr:MMPL family transporter [Streptosporangiaceae bacterium]